MMKNHGEIDMQEFEVIYAKRVMAEDFFDAVEISKAEGVEVLSVSSVPIEDDEDVLY